ncbi:hypothetical protein [Thermolongibacillus altinsuensis]|nr:hypothetical protein [Thermolongibacillus altinsuensis]
MNKLRVVPTHPSSANELAEEETKASKSKLQRNDFSVPLEQLLV